MQFLATLICPDLRAGEIGQTLGDVSVIQAQNFSLRHQDADEPPDSSSASGGEAQAVCPGMFNIPALRRDWQGEEHSLFRLLSNLRRLSNMVTGVTAIWKSRPCIRAYGATPHQGKLTALVPTLASCVLVGLTWPVAASAERVVADNDAGATLEHVDCEGAFEMRSLSESCWR